MFCRILFLHKDIDGNFYPAWFYYQYHKILRENDETVTIGFRNGSVTFKRESVLIEK
jgi:hypothetical protein